MLKLVNIKKDYKVADTKVPALKGVNLCFRENEFVGILGQSGCGKTTLLNIIGGLDHYTDGDLVIEGKSTKNFKDRDWDVYRNHRIGFIFQSYNLIPHQTVLGNVELALTIAGLGREERVERAKQALERVGLGAEINKRPNQLSGGQMQRVAIARALVNNPAILLADEPTGALDSKTSVEVMDLIREIAGERLVIMVTHNPELAEAYATRIVRLKDGEVESDSNPYTEEEEASEYLKAEEPVKEETAEEAVKAETAETPEEEGKKKKKVKKPRAKMGFFTALALSFRNLLTKKGRTILTSIGGSIGIISVCLVLALSNGFNHYIQKTEEDMLSYYPVRITESSLDMASAITSFTSPKDMPDLSQIGDRVYVDSFLINLGGNMTVKNNITDEYLDYIKKMDSSLYAAIQYGYGTSIVDNLFTKVDTLKDNGGSELTQTVRSLSNLKEHYISVVRNLPEEEGDYGSLVGFADFFGNIVHRMPNTSDTKASDFGSYVQSQYDVVKGSFPKTENEIVLVVGKNNEVSDLTLAQLGLLNENKFAALFKKGKGGNGIVIDENSTVDFSEIIGKEYTLFYNDAVYQKNYEGEWNQLLSFAGQYPFTYKDGGERKVQDYGANPLIASEEEGINLKVSGILRLKEGRTYGCLQEGLNITEQLIDTYVDKNMTSQIVEWLKNDAKFTIPKGTPGIPERFTGRDYWLSPSSNLNISIEKTNGYFSQVVLSEEENRSCFVSIDGETVIRALGGDKTVTSISIYASNFDKKEVMLAYLDEWNNTHEDKADHITYTDTVGVLMGMMQTMLNAITYVLVAFTAISLIVSSVMIGIITYVSVVERVKEIGVLRSLGARKRDIRHLFNAETFIIGLTAGVFGVVVSYLLSFIINAILNPLTGIAGLASLSPVAALVMICISVGLTLISGLIPASAAAKKDPVIALRTE